MTLKSMTAFGSGENQTESFQYRCEIKSLNSRFLDSNVRLPRSLGGLEASIIKEIKKCLKRGKVDVSLDITPLGGASKLPQLNEDAALHYLQIGSRIQEIADGYPKELSVYEIVRLEGTLESQQRLNGKDQLELHTEPALKAVAEALKELLKTRLQEGAALAPALQTLVDSIGEDRRRVAQEAEQIRESLFANYKKKLETFLEKLGDLGKEAGYGLSDERVLAEIAVMADKSDIAEELTRLEAHEEEFKNCLEKGDEVGRRLDFLCQEMHREVNTISNKVHNLDLANLSLNMKQAVERLRQQIQNIE